MKDDYAALLAGMEMAARRAGAVMLAPKGEKSEQATILALLSASFMGPYWATYDLPGELG